MSNMNILNFINSDDALSLNTLINNDKNLLNNNIGNMSLLDYSCYNGKIECTKMLINMNCKYNQSLLKNSCFSGIFYLVQWIYLNIDNNIIDDVYNSSLSNNNIDEFSKLTIIKYLILNNANPKKFIIPSIILQNNLVIEYLTNNGWMDLTLNYSSNFTILQILEKYNYQNPFIKYLLPDNSNKVYISITNNDILWIKNNLNLIYDEPLLNSNIIGTPFFYSFQIGNLEIIKLLLTTNPNINYKNLLGENLIFSSIYSNNGQVIRLARYLLSDNSINIINNNGFTPLYKCINLCCSDDVFLSLIQTINNKPPEDLTKKMNNNFTLDIIFVSNERYLIKSHNSLLCYQLLYSGGCDIDNSNNKLNISSRNYYKQLFPSFSSYLNNLEKLQLNNLVINSLDYFI